jgi:hypothetical protein
MAQNLLLGHYSLFAVTSSFSLEDFSCQRASTRYMDRDLVSAKEHLPFQEVCKKEGIKHGNFVSKENIT